MCSSPRTTSPSLYLLDESKRFRHVYGLRRYPGVRSAANTRAFIHRSSSRPRIRFNEERIQKASCRPSSQRLRPLRVSSPRNHLMRPILDHRMLPIKARISPPTTSAGSSPCASPPADPLGRSQLLSDFLLYIVERSIQGRRGEITEQQIGVAVFGRAEDYNSNDDNIVRSYARKLRQRIDNYYAERRQRGDAPARDSRAVDTPLPLHRSRFATSERRRALVGTASLRALKRPERVMEGDGPRSATTSGDHALSFHVSSSSLLVHAGHACCASPRH